MLQNKIIFIDCTFGSQPISIFKLWSPISFILNHIKALSTNLLTPSRLQDMAELVSLSKHGQVQFCKLGSMYVGTSTCCKVQFWIVLYHIKLNLQSLHGVPLESWYSQKCRYKKLLFVLLVWENGMFFYSLSFFMRNFTIWTLCFLPVKKMLKIFHFEKS